MQRHWCANWTRLTRRCQFYGEFPVSAALPHLYHWTMLFSSHCSYGTRTFCILLEAFLWQFHSGHELITITCWTEDSHLSDCRIETLHARKRDGGTVKLATAHQTKSRADVLLIKIPPAPPSRNGGHVFNSRTFPITFWLHKVNFSTTMVFHRRKGERLWPLSLSFKTECMRDWSNGRLVCLCAKEKAWVVARGFPDTSLMFSQNWPGALYYRGRDFWLE